jgi:CBS domain containing-hemolysin-like protein
MKELLGLSINSIENVFMSFAAFFLVLYFIVLLIEKKPKWFLTKKIQDCLSLEEKFTKLLSSRRDALHHYYWARS